MFHTEDPETSGASAQNLSSWATWHLGFVNSWFTFNANFHFVKNAVFLFWLQVGR
jgi:hypothetical protein